MTANNVLFHSFELIDLTIDSSLIQHFRSLLERCCRHKAGSLQCSTRDTLEYLRRCSRNGITYFNRFQVTTFQHTVFITQLAGSNNLTRLHILRITGINDHFLTPDTIVFFHKLKFIHNLLFKETRISRLVNFHLTHHLTNDYFEMLIIDLHTLQTVYILNFVHNIFLHCRRTFNCQNVCRSNSTIR